MKLDDTYICINCDEVFQMRYPKGLTCPRCGSKHTIMLRKWVMPMSNIRVETGLKPVCTKSVCTKPVSEKTEIRRAA